MDGPYGKSELKAFASLHRIVKGFCFIVEEIVLVEKWRYMKLFFKFQQEIIDKAVSLKKSKENMEHFFQKLDPVSDDALVEGNSDDLLKPACAARREMIPRHDFGRAFEFGPLNLGHFLLF